MEWEKEWRKRKEERKCEGPQGSLCSESLALLAGTTGLAPLWTEPQVQPLF